MAIEIACQRAPRRMDSGYSENEACSPKRHPYTRGRPSKGYSCSTTDVNARYQLPGAHKRSISYSSHPVGTRRVSTETLQRPQTLTRSRASQTPAGKDEEKSRVTPTRKSERQRPVRQNSGFLLPRAGLGRVSTDPSDCQRRNRTMRFTDLTVDTLAIPPRSSSYTQPPLPSPPTSPASLPSPLLQHVLRKEFPEARPSCYASHTPQSTSHISIFDAIKTRQPEQDDVSILHQKKLSVSSASSVPISTTASILTSPIYMPVPDDNNTPVVIDWTSPSTRRREYREIDRCNRGFRRVWKALAPKCCWCKSWRREFYNEKRRRKSNEGDYDNEEDDDTSDAEGDASSVRRYRLNLGDGNDEEKPQDYNMNNNNNNNDVYNDIHAAEANNSTTISSTQNPLTKTNKRSTIILRNRFRAGSQPKTKKTAEAQSEEPKPTKADPEPEKEKVKGQKVKRKKSLSLRQVCGENLICFQLHEIPV